MVELETIRSVTGQEHPTSTIQATGPAGRSHLAWEDLSAGTLVHLVLAGIVASGVLNR